VSEPFPSSEAIQDRVEQMRREENQRNLWLGSQDFTEAFAISNGADFLSARTQATICKRCGALVLLKISGGGMFATPMPLPPTGLSDGGWALVHRQVCHA
jgi:hypothetical protein